MLEEHLGVAPAALPPHLQRYALQRRSIASFSGPGVLPGEVEAGGWGWVRWTGRGRCRAAARCTCGGRMPLDLPPGRPSCGWQAIA